MWRVASKYVESVQTVWRKYSDYVEIAFRLRGEESRLYVQRLSRIFRENVQSLLMIAILYVERVSRMSGDSVHTSCGESVRLLEGISSYVKSVHSEWRSVQIV